MPSSSQGAGRAAPREVERPAAPGGGAAHPHVAPGLLQRQGAWVLRAAVLAHVIVTPVLSLQPFGSLDGMRGGQIMLNAIHMYRWTLHIPANLSLYVTCSPPPPPCSFRPSSTPSPPGPPVRPGAPPPDGGHAAPQGGAARRARAAPLHNGGRRARGCEPAGPRVSIWAGTALSDKAPQAAGTPLSAPTSHASHASQAQGAAVLTSVCM